MPARSVEWTLADPQFSYESNRSAWLSLTDAAGKLDDYLGADHQLDKHPWYRVASLLYSSATASVLGHYTHEVGHLQPGHDLGLRGPLTLIKDGDGFFPSKPVFNYKKTEENIFADRRFDILKAAAGFNQQTFNLQQLSARFVRHGKIPPDLALSYLLNAVFPPLYTLAGGGDVRDCGNRCNYDPIRYRDALGFYDRGVLSYKTYLGWQVGALALNGRVTDSVVSLLHYLRTGQRDSAPLSLAAGQTRFYLPEVNVFHHPNGLFLTVDEPMRGLLQPNDGLTAHLGVGVAGLLNAVRFGVEYSGLKTYPHWAAPEVTAGYLNTVWYAADKPVDVKKFVNPELSNRSFGHSAKLALKWQLPRGVGVEVGNQFSYQDPIESDIKLRGAAPLQPMKDSAHQPDFWWYSTVSYAF